MKHKTTQALFDYWNAMRAGRPAPRRSEIEPGDMRAILPYVFILERKDRDTYRFRLAGHNMISMWGDDCAENMKEALDDVIRNAGVAVVEYTAATTDGREATFEMVLLPLLHEDGSLSRVLGAAVPIDRAPWVGDRLLARQWIDRLRRLDPEHMPKREPAAKTAARRLAAEKPPVAVASLGKRMSQGAPLRSERSYLRLVKGMLSNTEEHG